ncbi:MAG: hypothetical protein IJ958_07655 [Agathobacter sp.]|nr:hypothetical protein [Agathobacter sp.]
MGNKILKTLSKNLGFKLLAVAFAFTLWVTVYNLDDPTKTKSLTVNVTVTNKEVLEEMGKYYEIADDTKKISFSVTAPRSILDKLDETDFVAEANLQKMTLEEDGDTARVPVEIICTTNANGNSIKISSTNKSVRISLEDLMIKQFVVQANAVGEVKEGYALGKVEVTAPNVLQVSGPKSIVSQITGVVATVDVTDMSEYNTSYRVTPILLDKNGNEVDTTRLTLSDTTVNVEVEILNTKEVELAVTPMGEVAEGYAVTAVTVNPSTISLKGSKSVLNNISNIVIPSEVVSVEGATHDVTVQVDVSEYIPEGAGVLDPEQATVEIVVSVEKIKTKSFTINTADIMVTGLPTHCNIEYDLSSVAVDVTGLESDINALSNTQIGWIDVTDLGVGTHRVDLTLDLDGDKYTYETIQITIIISREEMVEGDDTQE